MTTPLTKAALVQAAFWGEAVCLACGTLQTEREPGEDCQECEMPCPVLASTALQFLDLLEQNDE